MSRGQIRMFRSTLRVVARAAVMALPLAAMAWPTIGQTNDPNLVGSGWRIMEVSGRPADPGATIAFEKTRVSGSTGCNRFFASLQLKTTEISVGPIATTKMFCGPRAAIERDTLAALGRVSSAKREGERVALLDASGKAVVVLGR